MEDKEAVTTTLDGEQHMIAAAHHLLKALSASKNVNSDMRRLLADLDIHLSKMTKLNDDEAESLREVEERLKSAQRKIVSLQSNHYRIWDSGPQHGLEYLEAVDEVRTLTESLVSSRRGKQKGLVLNQAHSILQMAMERLQEEVANILAQNKHCFEHEYLSFRSCEENVVDEESIVSSENESAEEASRRESSGTEPEEYRVDLIHPDVIPHIKCIANVMFASHYYQEFCQIFVTFWENALSEYFSILHMEYLSIEDVLNMEWNCLNRRIKKWLWAMKNIIGFYLPIVKRLFDEILGELGSVSSTSFYEASKASMLCLLNFGQAVAVGPLLPERLFCLLDMYEVIANLRRDMDAMFGEGEEGSFIRAEFHELEKRLGDSAKVIFLEFGNKIASETSTTPLIKGGVQPLTKYVMNYLMLLAEYCHTLNFLIEENTIDHLNQVIDEEDLQKVSSVLTCPVAHHLQSITSILEANLLARSNLYRNPSLKHIYMMNNLHYMVQKIKNSKIRACFGDSWIRQKMGQFRQHAMTYERITWSPILSLIRNDGSTDKTLLRERCRSFNAAFEEVYKSQTGWLIPDLQLRDDVRISTSKNVVPAFRVFFGSVKDSVGDRYIKYTPDDLENCILDLFEGLPKSLSHHWRR
ncbi:exocyst complex component EXO70E2-like [Ipomoea triloba]|uniref:exocyst complex component EXO70E2-like n=1 Tax=Ipomoea triloba TaxID=35885 RepID=UPI00125D434F|nr:exocyst complex component EXO70E2-like [Ipomoea triloba]XP_031105448.1 exocyst complex component EXO70E2-like [Ipomoea triloba]